MAKGRDYCKNLLLKKIIFTARKGSLGQGNIFRSVCQEFCSQGGNTWAARPGSGTPPGTRYTPHPPRTRHTPRDQVHPPGPGTPRDQVHPQGPGTPRPGTPPGPGTLPPPDQVHTPQEQCMLGDTGNKRAVRILLECIFV